ncbi:MAG: TlpA family protein disulfide reductase, partial [Planctomycetaceae bacterium]
NGGPQAAAGLPDEGVPRYRLSAGQELLYETHGEFSYQNGGDSTFNRLTDTTRKLRVVRRNDDGSWRIVMHETTLRRSQRGDDEPSDSPAQVTLAWFDLHPDGRVPHNSSLGYRVRPSSLFVRLPPDAPSLKAGWEDAVELDSGTRHHKLADVPDANSAEIIIEVTTDSPMNAVYESTSSAKYHFDTDRGLVTRIETENSQGYGIQGKGSGTTELKSVETIEPDELAEFVKETGIFFETKQKYDELQTKAYHDFENAETLLADAKAVLTAVQDTLTLPVLTKQVEDDLASHDSSAKSIQKQATRFGELIGQPSPEWDTTDLDGEKHALQDYRGKVVLLDFWYRGCGWCIRAMPQLRQLAEEFEGRPVAVLGMNTDRDESDAKFVIESLKLNYPNLKAEGLPEKYKVQAFPTMVLIDQQGRVHHVHVGYSPTLREDIGAKITALLKEEPAAAP